MHFCFQVWQWTQSYRIGDCWFHCSWQKFPFSKYSICLQNPLKSFNCKIYLLWGKNRISLVQMMIMGLWPNPGCITKKINRHEVKPCSVPTSPENDQRCFITEKYTSAIHMRANDRSVERWKLQRCILSCRDIYGTVGKSWRNQISRQGRGTMD